MNANEFPKQYPPQERDRHWQTCWEDSGIFVADAESDRPMFSIMIPPPNVTGSLHLGHALELALIDTIVRYQRMVGKNVLWLPGTDHASIAVQTILEKQLKAEGRDRIELGREQFLGRAWQWKAESGGTIVNQIRRLGASADWSRERFTLDAGLSAAVNEAFVRLYGEGLIYRGEYLVNWCPASRSAVSDLEVDNQEVQGSLWHFRYPLSDGSGYLVVATTRPETMLGDTAVAVHPEDDRYRHLIGKTVRLPLQDRDIPIIGDAYVDPQFGSGCVKVTPAHDFNDFEIGKRHQLPFINILNPDATLNAHGGTFAGLDRFVARKQVVASLEELALVERIEPYSHSVPYSERGKVPIEPYLSTQWFVNIRPLADRALKELDQNQSPQFVPERWSKVYRDWLVKLKDWCISRQLWWGHQIPAWYAPDGTMFVARTETEARTQAQSQFGAPVDLVRDGDVLDTWFSSGLWCCSTLGWPADTADLGRFYPTTLLVTGFDIIFFWVARMTMMSGWLTGDIPFGTVYIHGLVRDENNQKMSKSKNNGIDPLLLIEKYGTDALRYALVREVVGAGQDIRLDYNRKTDESPTVEVARNFATKLWNASRFVLMNLTPEGSEAEEFVPTDLELGDRWILSRYHRAIAQVRSHLERYGLGEAAKVLYDFIWGDFCDWYIELVKGPLQGQGMEARLAQQVLYLVLEGTLRLFHPFMPHITEEIWQILTGGDRQNPGTFLAVQSYPVADEHWIDDELEAQFELLIAVIRTIRNLRAEAEIKPSQTISVILRSDDATVLDHLRPTERYIQELAKVVDLQWVVGAIAAPQSLGGVAGTVEVILPLSGLIDIGKFQQKLERNLKKLDEAIAQLDARLSNDSYRQKAPPEKIAATLAEREAALQQRQILQARWQEFQESNT
ncbi:MAG: valine--tRNA ligase [Oscillatoriales cyanobacterium SM2_2_1]|nr:valine--tRNA ligase [Oscillatoriales cyanobacterium SM2_2_1]